MSNLKDVQSQNLNLFFLNKSFFFKKLENNDMCISFHKNTSNEIRTFINKLKDQYDIPETIEMEAKQESDDCLNKKLFIDF